MLQQHPQAQLALLTTFTSPVMEQAMPLLRCPPGGKQQQHQRPAADHSRPQLEPPPIDLLSNGEHFSEEAPADVLALEQVKLNFVDRLQ
mmetsp:Transcript_33510/g.66000  ORF Transcript_33510/g.66000 Transcript_33510/m.66000 type:complete len:89 (-) Transcript_33510:108-374(-)